jgi:hypothetical protein
MIQLAMDMLHPTAAMLAMALEVWNIKKEK